MSGGRGITILNGYTVVELELQRRFETGKKNRLESRMQVRSR